MFEKYSTEARWVLIGVIVGLALVALLSAPVSAQADSPVNESDNSTEANETSEPQENKYAREINPSVKLVRADFGVESVELVIYSDIPGMRVAATDMGQSASNIDSARGSGGGSYDLTFRRMTLDKGYNTFTIPITRFEGLSAIALTSGENGIQVVEYEPTNDGIIPPPYGAWDAIIGLLVGVISLGFGTRYYLKKRETTDESEEPTKVIG